MRFVPVEIDDYIDLHLKANSGCNREELRGALRAALAALLAGKACACGNRIWVIGSATAGRACFSCITGEAVPDEDFEIAEACRWNEAEDRAGARPSNRQGDERIAKA